MPERAFRSIVLSDVFPETTPGQPAPVVDRLAVLAKFVRTLYIATYREYTGKKQYGASAMPRWDGGEDKWGTRHKSTWRKIAEIIVRTSADPFLFIRAPFLATPNNPPRPNFLHGERAVAIYRNACENNQERLNDQVMAELTSLRTQARILQLCGGLDEKRSLWNAISDRSLVSASDFVRYCVAVDCQFDAAVARLHESALLDYVFQQPDYDAVFSSFIPESLRREALELRRQLGV
jgi:hypothetical protein